MSISIRKQIIAMIDFGLYIGRFHEKFRATFFNIRNLPTLILHATMIDITLNPLKPRQVLLFSGHMVDTPDRAVPRFPIEKTNRVKAAIEKTLANLDAGARDLAFTQGASGGDLLFAECCQERDVELRFLQPFAEPEFIERSIKPSVGEWEQRYQAVKRKMKIPIQRMPDTYLTASDNPFEACNLWLLETVLAFGPENTRFICLWNGVSGDGAGGTAHMVDHVTKCGGRVIWLDIRMI